jgi:hypothetical protein
MRTQQKKTQIPEVHKNLMIEEKEQMIALTYGIQIICIISDVNLNKNILVIHKNKY